MPAYSERFSLDLPRPLSASAVAKRRTVYARGKLPTNLLPGRERWCPGDGAERGTGRLSYTR